MRAACAPNDIRGGVAYDKYVFELRYPITASQASTIYVLGFAEAGNNFGNLSQFNPLCCTGLLVSAPGFLCLPLD